MTGIVRSPRSSRPRYRASAPQRPAASAISKHRQLRERRRTWPLEIKILDYGDIELESSFLVLGRDCGRTRRVLTLGFLITGGA